MTKPVSRSVVVLFLIIGMAAGCGGGDANIRPVQDLPADVARVVGETWSAFEAAFAGRLDCVAPVELALVGSVEDGDAAYLAQDRLIIIEIPTSPERFRESLAHELGHHIQQTCPDADSLHSGFLEAQGFSAEKPWDSGPSWAETPAEHFSEVVVLLINQDRLLHADLIPLSDRAVEFVAIWADGN